MVVLLHSDLPGVTEVDADPKEKYVSFKVTPSNDRVLSVYAPPEHSTREKLARGREFDILQSYKENKCERNETKLCLETLIILCIKSTGIAETPRPYIFCSNYALPKLIMDNRRKNLWRRSLPAMEFNRNSRSSGTRYRIDWVYTNVKTVAIPELITKCYLVLIIIMQFLLKDST